MPPLLIGNPPSQSTRRGGTALLVSVAEFYPQNPQIDLGPMSYQLMLQPTRPALTTEQARAEFDRLQGSKRN